jgi:ribosomal protein S18 acetylase RimI-like enzyme
MDRKESVIAPNLVLRSVGVGEADQVLGLYAQCEDFLALGPAPQATREMVLADMEHSALDNGDYRGVYEGGQLVGVVDWVAPPYGGDQAKAFINLLMIAAKCRNRGIGRRTLKFVESQVAKCAAAAIIETAVQVNNDQARRFWKRQGYEVVAGPISNPDGTTVHLLQKEIRR